MSPSDINPSGLLLFRFRDAEIKADAFPEKEKALRYQPQRLRMIVASQTSSGLLDRRELPIRSPRANEGPHLSRLGRLIAALDQPSAGAIEGLVDQREPHRHAGIIGVALAPGFREV